MLKGYTKKENKRFTVGGGAGRTEGQGSILELSQAASLVDEEDRGRDGDHHSDPPREGQEAQPWGRSQHVTSSCRLAQGQ